MIQDFASTEIRASKQPLSYSGLCLMAEGEPGIWADRGLTG